MKLTKEIYHKVHERDRGLCRRCGRAGNDIHHIIFKSHMGNNDIRNLITLCRRCHTSAHKNEKESVDYLLGLQYTIYGKFDSRVLKEKDRYNNFKFPRGGNR